MDRPRSMGGEEWLTGGSGAGGPKERAGDHRIDGEGSFSG